MQAETLRATLGEHAGTEAPRPYTYRVKKPNGSRQAANWRRWWHDNPKREEHLAKKREYARQCQARYRANNRESHKRLWADWRAQAIAAYGAKCACCGLADTRFLTFDHVNGGGRKHRKRVGGLGFLVWMRKNNYPLDIQLLCYNCNGAKWKFGACPHQEVTA